MMWLLLVSFMMMFKPYIFFFVFLCISMKMLSSISWSGLFIFMDSYVFVLLVLMMIFIYGVVIISEPDGNLKYLSLVLIIFCYFFFFSSNMLMLYMFFELSMFPILVMILGFGYQIEKINSSYYLLFYTIFCSLPFLYVYYSSFFYLSYSYFDFCLSWEILLVLSLSFMVKFPVYFLHLWLPKAHVEAPTTASMLLAGLLLKLGTAGFLRILGSMNFSYNNFWVILSLMGMILSVFGCMFQSDSKSLAAYSSIAHMSFLLLAMSMFFISGKTGSLLLMLAHGYTSTLMFYMIGEFYHSSFSRMMYFFNSLMGSSMIFGLLFFFVFLSNSGVPPSLSFLSEFMVISNGMLFSKIFFLLILVYFVLSFYYCVYLIICSCQGSKFINLLVFKMGYGLPLVVMMFNIFWLSLMY
uniref:NADH-ubiquinone oxidoreductase chain 4 n=1 Tax=Angiostrongylus costaricensis TaxID=334426 RepID=A0A0K1L629_ANGCS|nr:NADH dehydrogenase subunit 4 [Angiostrongylus costaricensis]BAV82627.1 NADH dehydrogenase subunit 4 [Angiostrongylus costaricensis]